MVNYKISRCRRVVENAFGILASRFIGVLGTIKQTPKLVRDIVLINVVLHSMLWTQQGRAGRVGRPTNIFYKQKVKIQNFTHSLTHSFVFVSIGAWACGVLCLGF